MNYQHINNTLTTLNDAWQHRSRTARGDFYILEVHCISGKVRDGFLAQIRSTMEPNAPIFDGNTGEVQLRGMGNTLDEALQNLDAACGTPARPFTPRAD